MTTKWWQTAVFYQIYPRSFADGNGDGIGDFAGMTKKLDYLSDLGVDAIWLSPHFPSPQADCGYDVSDYTGVAPEYGTLADFKRFLDEAHRRGLRVIADLVLNHTSDEHAWFKESRASLDSPKRDWYIWRDGVNGGSPNDWISAFDGSAWELDPHTGQYYYHFFLRQQPDLNWRNPEVKAAMFAAARFWLDLGVDGFRLDAIGTIYEHPGLPRHNLPYTLADLRRMDTEAHTPALRRKAYQLRRRMERYQIGQPGLHELMKELRQVLDEYPGERMLVGEDENIAYHGDGDDELHLVFNFPLMKVDRLTPAHVRRNQARRLAALDAIGAWPCNTLGNHDSPRLFSRYGDGVHNDAQARLHLALLLSLRGTPFLYNGEEIGMTNHILTDIADFRDLLATWTYQAFIDTFHMPPAEALERAAHLTRDRCRTPMQWSNVLNGGFCPPEVRSWLPVNPNWAEGVNVAEQEGDPTSMLNYYKILLRVRKASTALQLGDYQPLGPRRRNVLAFLRRSPEQTVLAAFNFSRRSQRFDWLTPLGGETACRVLFRSHGEDGMELESPVRLAPFEVVIAERIRRKHGPIFSLHPGC